MAKVRVVWEETVTYNQVFEIENFDPGNDYYFQDKLSEAITDQANFNVVEEVSAREITDWQVIPE